MWLCDITKWLAVAAVAVAIVIAVLLGGIVFVHGLSPFVMP